VSERERERVCVFVGEREVLRSVKKDLLQCQKRPNTVSKETYYSVKRDLLQCVCGRERSLA